MSDLGWLIVGIILLCLIAGAFVWLWRNGEGENGLKGEFGERVSNLEDDVEKIWIELRRQSNRWIP